MYGGAGATLAVRQEGLTQLLSPRYLHLLNEHTFTSNPDHRVKDRKGEKEKGSDGRRGESAGRESSGGGREKILYLHYASSAYELMLLFYSHSDL